MTFLYFDVCIMNESHCVLNYLKKNDLILISKSYRDVYSCLKGTHKELQQ